MLKEAVLVSRVEADRMISESKKQMMEIARLLLRHYLLLWTLATSDIVSVSDWGTDTMPVACIAVR